MGNEMSEQKFNTALNTLSEFIKNEKTDYTLTRTTEHIRVCANNSVVILALGSMRLVLADSEHNAYIVIQPVQIQEHGIDKLVYITQFDDDFERTYDTLDINYGELFQYSTLYNYDFGIIEKLMPKYLEVLRNLLDSHLTDSVDNTILVESIENIKAAISKE